MTHIKVSVVIPSYNVETYIASCLDSLLGQTLKEIQIICVDDCSTDGTVKIIEDYQKKDPRILLLRQEKNGGQSKARNRGISVATGEYIYFLDSDDWLEFHGLEQLYGVAVAQDLDVLFFDSQVFYQDEESKEAHESNLENLDRKENSPVMTGLEALSHFISYSGFFETMWVQFIKLSYLKEKKILVSENLKYEEDAFFTLKNLVFAQRVATVDLLLHHYRVRASSHMTLDTGYERISKVTQFYMEAVLFLHQQDLPKEQEWIPWRYLHYKRENLVRLFAKKQNTIHDQAEECLTNLEALLRGTPLVSLLSFQQYKENPVDLCFFGAGIEGEKALVSFEEKNLPFPLAICDNNPKLWGTEMRGVPVMSFPDVLEKHENIYIQITNRRYFEEISTQVVLEKGRILRLIPD